MPLGMRITIPGSVNSHQIAQLENPIPFRSWKSREKCDYLMKTMLSNKIINSSIMLVRGIVLHNEQHGWGPSKWSDAHKEMGMREIDR